MQLIWFFDEVCNFIDYYITNNESLRPTHKHITHASIGFKRLQAPRHHARHRSHCHGCARCDYGGVLVSCWRRYRVWGRGQGAHPAPPPQAPNLNQTPHPLDPHPTCCHLQADHARWLPAPSHTIFAPANAAHAAAPPPPQLVPAFWREDSEGVGVYYGPVIKNTPQSGPRRNS